MPQTDYAASAPTQLDRDSAARAFLEDSEAEAAAWDARRYGLGEDWLILTEEEADAETTATIERDLWAFVSSFTLSYMPEGMTEEALSCLSEKLCEDAAPVFRSMIGERFEDFVSDAIAADGRGHFLALWDGAEYEFEHEGRSWYAYRV